MSDANTIEWGNLKGFCLVEGMYVREAASPDPPKNHVFKFDSKVVGKNKAGKKKKPKAVTGDDAPEQSFQEVNTLNYRKFFESTPVYYWGELNTFPQIVDAEAEKCDVLEAALKRITDHLYGQEFYFYEEVFKDGVMQAVEVDEPEMRQYFYDIGYYEYYGRACKELPRWGNIWPVYLMNKERKIVQIKMYDAAWCRLEKPHFETGKIEAIYVSAQWGHGLVITDAEMVKDPFFSRWVSRYELLDENNYLDQLELETETYTWARHLKYHTSGKAYGRAPWHAAYKNRWTAMSAAVPEMKMRLFEYAMTINYVCYINEEYWKSKFPGINGEPGWDDWDTTVRQVKIKDKQREIEEHLGGKANAWKTLFSGMIYDGNSTPEKMIIIEAINNTLKEGNYIPDSQIADTHILGSVGVDPTLMGLGGNSAGGGQQEGSGSNIREASQALSAALRPDREIVNTPFYEIRDYMFPDKKNIKIGVRDFVINTLDNQPAKPQAAIVPVKTKLKAAVQTQFEKFRIGLAQLLDKLAA